MMVLAEARDLAVKSIRKAQKRYKAQYDKHAAPSDMKASEWVFVHFPQEQTGWMRKLSCPWHGPYRICTSSGPDVSVTRVYFPGEVHLKRVMPCPPYLPAGFFWYGPKHKSPDNPPRWVETMMSASRQLTDKSECFRDEVGTAGVGAPIDDHSSIPCSQESTETDGIPLSGEETESPPGPPSQVGEQPC